MEVTWGHVGVGWGSHGVEPAGLRRQDVRRIRACARHIRGGWYLRRQDVAQDAVFLEVGRLSGGVVEDGDVVHVVALAR
eukprot:3485067-Prymnesium_polylepis.1